MNVVKKNFNLLIIVCIVICFNLIAHSLWSNYFRSTGSIKLPDTITSAKTGNINTILTGNKSFT